MVKQDTHENFRREEALAPGSDRSFAMVIAAALAGFAAFDGWREGAIWPWLAACAAAMAAIGIVRPAALRPLNRAWFRLGLAMHAVVNPLVMGLIFFGAVLPTGLVMRALGHDLLRLKRDPRCDTYWIVRHPPGPAPETMTEQF
jgi:hypothetical protein